MKNKNEQLYNNKKIEIINNTNFLNNQDQIINSETNISNTQITNIDHKTLKYKFPKMFYFSQNQLLKTIKEKKSNKINPEMTIIKKPSPIFALSIKKTENQIFINVTKKEIKKKKFGKNDFEEALTIYERGYSKKKRKKRFVLKHFDNLVRFLTKIFQNKRPSFNLYQLNNESQQIMIRIFVNKNNNILSKREKLYYFNDDIIFKEKFEKMMNNLELKKFQKSFKRKEENMKFIFNTIIKKLKIKFFQENNYCFNEKSEKLFYEYYFQRKENLSLCNILSKRKAILNNKILTLFFSFKKFKKEFLFYLKNYFKKIYLKEINKKLENMFKRYEKKYPDFKICSEKILDTLKSKNKFKFPWNIFEVQNSIYEFYSILNDIE